ncbi:MAG: HD domain-containing phosphohydrolase [Desulfobacula sp.]|jgi:HD-GYP domain-containing protein (c-di-GMP phosphodiesterase class II)
MQRNGKFSENSRINLVIENILDELCPFLEEQAKEISELTAIGKALGTGKDIRVLLKMILSIARRFSKADGGTLYLVNEKKKKLDFHVFHNDSLNINEETGNSELQGVSLYHENGMPNLSNVSSYAFHTGKIINIDDVYKTKKFQFDGTRKFDEALNYRSKSMVVIPMRNHEDDIIGILQLINSKDSSSQKIISFSKDAQEKAAALASQASVILTQQRLIIEMKELFEAFIKAIAISIDEKSKHTGGHIQRVTELCMMIAKKINDDTTIFKHTHLSDDLIDELRIAALMHDTGKITTPDHIISKSSRLETVFDRIELIRMRWEFFKANLKLTAAQKKLLLFDQTEKQKEMAWIDSIYKQKIDSLETEMMVLASINSSKEPLDQTLIDQLENINEKYCEVSEIAYLTEDEFENLCVIKGTLTSGERDIINNHARLTEKILNKLPWPKKLANIPSIAGAHHEKLDGSGYPLHLNKENINIQARILAIADIFEALCAKDRPYKKPMTLNMTVTILRQMAENQLIDNDIVKLFFESGVHMEYAKRHLSPDQIDL